MPLLDLNKITLLRLRQCVDVGPAAGGVRLGGAAGRARRGPVGSRAALGDSLPRPLWNPGGGTTSRPQAAAPDQFPDPRPQCHRAAAGRRVRTGGLRRGGVHIPDRLGRGRSGLLQAVSGFRANTADAPTAPSGMPVSSGGGDCAARERTSLLLGLATAMISSSGPGRRMPGIGRSTGGRSRLKRSASASALASHDRAHWSPSCAPYARRTPREGSGVAGSNPGRTRSLGCYLACCRWSGRCEAMKRSPASIGEQWNR